MKRAIEEAKLSVSDVPVGAVLEKDGVVLAIAHNRKEELNDVTAHAEILVIKEAQKKLNSFRLSGCTMYVTLEPCSMCAGAIIQSRIKKIYIGTMDPKTGACGSVLNLLEDYPFNHRVEVERGILKEECEEQLKQFFKELRQIKKDLRRKELEENQ